MNAFIHTKWHTRVSTAPPQSPTPTIDLKHTARIVDELNCVAFIPLAESGGSSSDYEWMHIVSFFFLPFIVAVASSEDEVLVHTTLSFVLVLTLASHTRCVNDKWCLSCNQGEKIIDDDDGNPSEWGNENEWENCSSMFSLITFSFPFACCCFGMFRIHPTQQKSRRVEWEPLQSKH